MKKKLLIFLVLFSFFCQSITPILAQTPSTITNFSQSSESLSNDTNNSHSVLGLFDVLQTIWDWLADTYDKVVNFITNLPFYSKPTPTSEDTSKFNNDYTRDDKNINTRAMPEKMKEYRKGVWFYEVLNPEGEKEKYYKDDQLIENKNLGDCPKEMKIIDVIYFYYLNQDKYPKILYKRGQMNTPVDYPSDIIESLNVHLNFPDYCYINAYNNLPDVPIGWFFLGKNSEDDTSSLLSTQLNDSIRTIIANNAQGESAPPTVDDEFQARLIAEDTDKQERNMLLHLIPEAEHAIIPCGDNSTKNRNYLRIAYTNSLYPQNWPRNSFNSGKTYDGLTVTEGGTSSGEDTNSMSQHGAHGMSLHAYDYKQILSAYFGDVTTKVKDEKDESLTISVFIETLYGDDSFDSCENIGSGTLYKPDIENGKGGFKLVSKRPKVIEECSIANGDYIPIMETYYDKQTDETKTRETGKYEEKIPDTCRAFIKNIKLSDYLRGIAETPVSWHIEFQKAHIIVCRQHALQSKSGTATLTNGEKLGEWVYNNSNTQAFRCDQASGIGSTSNLAVAVKLTNGEYVVSNSSSEEPEVSERSYFGRPQVGPPYFDGTAFENLSMIKHSGYYDSVTGICFNALKPNLNDNNNPETANTQSQSPIIKNYDIATVDNGKWLEIYSGNNQTNINHQVLGIQSYSDKCYLDSRIFPSLNSLISSLNQDIPDNQIIFDSCYRSLTDQNKLWINALKKWGSQAEAMKYINKPGESPHHTGKAIDFSDKNGKLNTNSSIYQWLVKNGSRFGFYNYQLEPEHWVYNP